MITLANYGTFAPEISEPSWYRAERYDYCEGYSFIGRKHIQLHAFIAKFKKMFA